MRDSSGVSGDITGNFRSLTMPMLCLENVIMEKSLAQLFILYDEKQMSKSFKVDLNVYRSSTTVVYGFVYLFTQSIDRSMHDQWWTKIYAYPLPDGIRGKLRRTDS